MNDFLAASCLRGDEPKKQPGVSTNVTLIALDPFCHRQFDNPQNRRPGEKIAMSTDDFMEKLLEEVYGLGGSQALVDGYVLLTHNRAVNTKHQ